MDNMYDNMNKKRRNWNT